MHEFEKGKEKIPHRIVLHREERTSKKLGPYLSIFVYYSTEVGCFDRIGQKQRKIRMVTPSPGSGGTK
jgi:hypothetical protein